MVVSPSRVAASKREGRHDEERYGAYREILVALMAYRRRPSGTHGVEIGKNKKTSIHQANPFCNV